MKHSRRIDFAVLGAVLHEVQNLDAILTSRSVDEVAGGVFTIGEFQDHSILIGATGIGKVNAAISAAALLANYDIGQVWNVGCAGCFEQGELTVGDVLITKLFLCGDAVCYRLQAPNPCNKLEFRCWRNRTRFILILSPRVHWLRN